jgi:hypothetical protein
MRVECCHHAESEINDVPAYASERTWGSRVTFGFPKEQSQWDMQCVRDSLHQIQARLPPFPLDKRKIARRYLNGIG